MIDISILQSSCYSKSYFSVINTGVVPINERANAGIPNRLQTVEIIIPQKTIMISNEFLKDGSRIYRKITEYDSNYSYRSDCDGILLTEKENQKYLITIELKSGYNEVKSKAIYQLVTSEIKTGHYLSLLKEFDLSDYRLIGLVFSYPPSSCITSNDDMADAKDAMIINQYGSTASKCDNCFRYNKDYMLLPDDFYFTELHIKHPFIPAGMVLKHIPVPANQQTFTFDLNTIL